MSTTPDTAAVLSVLVDKGLAGPCSPEWMRRVLSWPSIRLNAALGKLRANGWARRHDRLKGMLLRLDGWAGLWQATPAGVRMLREWQKSTRSAK